MSTIPDALKDLLDTGPSEAIAGHVTIAGYEWPIYPWTNHDLLLIMADLSAAEGSGALLDVSVRMAWLILRKGAPGMTTAKREAFDFDCLTVAQAGRVFTAYREEVHGGSMSEALKALAKLSGAPVLFGGGEGEEEPTVADPTSAPEENPAQDSGGDDDPDVHRLGTPRPAG